MKVLNMMLRVFKASHLLATGDVGKFSPNAPLWRNLQLREFYS